MTGRPCASLLILVLLTCGPASAEDRGPANGAQARNAWVYRSSDKDGSFRKEAGKSWVEYTPGGAEYYFEELERTNQYVDLFDGSRTMGLRLFADHVDWRQGKEGRWNRLYAGRWVDQRTLPAMPKPDYRIRLAYFVPTDREPTADYEKKIRVLMHFVAEIYRQDFEGRKIRSEGLRFQTHDGEPVVHLVRGRRTAAFYNDAPNYNPQHQWDQIVPEIPPEVGSPGKNLIIIFAETYDPGEWKFEWPGGVALGGRLSTDGGVGLFSAWILRSEFCATTVERQKQLLFDATPIKGRIALGNGQMNSPRFEFIEDGFGAVAHELGHALGLPHDNRRDDLYIMGNGFRNLRWNFTDPPDRERRARFSDDNARILYSSRYLATDLVLSDRAPPAARLTWAAPLHPGAAEVKVAIKATDDVGLRAILFFEPVQDSVVGGRGLAGKEQEFEQTLKVRPLQAGPFRLMVLVADAGGNLTRIELTGTVGM